MWRQSVSTTVIDTHTQRGKAASTPFEVRGHGTCGYDHAAVLGYTSGWQQRRLHLKSAASAEHYCCPLADDASMDRIARS
jgi:hypothetical protein